MYSWIGKEGNKSAILNIVVDAFLTSLYERCSIPLFYECYMMHGQHLTGVNHPTDHSMIFNYTPDMLRYYPRCWNKSAWTICLSSVIVFKGWWYMYGYAISLFYECYMRNGPRLTGVNHPSGHVMTSNYTPYMLRCCLGYWTQEPEPWTSAVV